MLDELESYQFKLPEELIAKFPVTPRDHSRLMVIDRSNGRIDEIPFYQLPQFLERGDRIVFNNTKVIPARLIGRKETGGQVELLLLEQKSDDCWITMSRPARKLKTGTKIVFSDQLLGEIVEEMDEGMRLVRFDYDGVFWEVLAAHGEMPLPPYLQREEFPELDKERYQTIYAKHEGAVAAPTAGLHFTENLLDELKRVGVDIVEVTLHVGLGTFRPVVAKTITDHKMHEERYLISSEAAAKLNTPAKREICVGTTCCRALESAANEKGKVFSGDGRTDIFIYPGYQFKKVSSLLTNFHLPGSTLLMLVSALAGYDLTMNAYKKAVLDRFRFFSYGDAMLILYQRIDIE